MARSATAEGVLNRRTCIRIHTVAVSKRTLGTSTARRFVGEGFFTLLLVIVID